MISQIKKDLEQLLNNHKVVNLDNKNDIQQKVDNYLYANYNNYDCKVVCDQTNNINDDDFTVVDVYIKPNPTPTYTVLNATIVRDKIKELREKRIEKLKKLNEVCKRNK